MELRINEIVYTHNAQKLQTCNQTLKNSIKQNHYKQNNHSTHHKRVVLDDVAFRDSAILRKQFTKIYCRYIGTQVSHKKLHHFQLVRGLGLHTCSYLFNLFFYFFRKMECLNRCQMNFSRTWSAYCICLQEQSTVAYSKLGYGHIQICVGVHQNCVQSGIEPFAKFRTLSFEKYFAACAKRFANVWMQCDEQP